MTYTPLAHYDASNPVIAARLELRVSADTVRRWAFESSSFTRRGYDPQAVERFRVQVADELDVLQRQLADQRAQVDRLQEQVELHRHGVLPAAAAPSGPSAREINLLSAAQREAEQIVAQAHAYARKVAEYAREQYTVFMRQAVEDAAREAERIIDERCAVAGVDATAVSRETLRVVGDLMLAHMEAASRQLDVGMQQIARAMQVMASTAGPGVGNPALGASRGA